MDYGLELSVDALLQRGINMVAIDFDVRITRLYYIFLLVKYNVKSNFLTSIANVDL